MHSRSALTSLVLLLIASFVHAQTVPAPATAAPVCAEHVGVDESVVFFPPEMLWAESGFLEADNLTLVVLVSTWWDNTEISFVDADNDLAALSPSATNTQWAERSDLSDECFTAWELDAAWADLYTNGQGGITRDDASDPTFIVFEGVVQVYMTTTITEDTYQVDIPREDTQVMPFVVRFQKVVAVLAVVQVFSDVALEAIVLSQTITADTSALAGEALATTEVLLATILQYPFKMDTTSAAVTTDVVALQTDLAISNTVDCADTDTAPCTQTWTIDVFPRVCELDGDFTVTFDNGVICQASSAADCPLDNDTNDASLEITLDSAVFCSTVVEDIGLTAVMGTWGDAAFTDAKDDYLVGQRMYFRAIADSTQATIVATEVVEITANSPLSLPLLEDGGQLSAYGTLADIVVVTDLVPADEAHFSMLIESTVFPVAALSNVEVEVLAVLAITFADTTEVLLKSSFRVPAAKRSEVELLQELDSQDVGVNGGGNLDGGDVEVADVEDDTVGGVDKTIVYALVGVCVGLLALGAVAWGVRVSKRRRATAVDPMEMSAIA